jgi:CRISPR-associated protein Cmr2
MTGHLLLVTIGPVQDFIAQARRTRDLWYGSHLLSELSRQAARTLVAQGARLIFPALALGDPELEPCMAPLRASGEPPQNIANKLLAELPAALDPAAVARAVRAAVASFWRDKLAAPIKDDCRKLLLEDIDAVWREQIDTLLDFNAAWAPLHDYNETRHSIECAVSARKGLRDFTQWQHIRGNRPKSSLDGARETVLRHPRYRDVALVKRYRINDQEDLDAVGLVKRAGGAPEQFISIVNIALASWLNYARRNCPDAVQSLADACKRLGLAATRRDLPVARLFPFDASIVMPSRWRAVFEEQGLPGDPNAWGQRHVQPLLAKLPDPPQYVACLVADGDRIGHALDALGSIEEHRAFSRALSRFAGDARRIVEREEGGRCHFGSLVYAGGDDVMAFLPVPEALACADRLRLRFTEIMKDALPTTSAPHPTLSVGIGIGHVMDGMGELLQLAREAERDAKGERNAVAILVDKRSGGRRRWRTSWTTEPVARIEADIRLLRDTLPARKIFEIETTLHRLPAVAGAGDWSRVLAMEVRRSLARAEAGERAITLDEAHLPLDATRGYEALRVQVTEWIDRVLIAREFRRADPSPGHAPIEESA